MNLKINIRKYVTINNKGFDKKNYSNNYKNTSYNTRKKHLTSNTFAISHTFSFVLEPTEHKE